MKTLKGLLIVVALLGTGFVLGYWARSSNLMPPPVSGLVTAPQVPLARSKFALGDCLMPDNTDNPVKILRVVGVGDDQYKTFSHLLFGGQLGISEDYGHHERAEIDEGYAKVECPKTDPKNTFVPDPLPDGKKGDQ
jgi:hypothetical protein